MRLRALISAFVLIFALNTCAYAEGYGRGYKYVDGGGIFTNSVIPLGAAKYKDSEDNFVNVSNIDLSRLKVGKSYKTNILKLIEIGDAGINAAAKNGHITKIHYVETKKNKVFIPLLFLPIHVDKVETVVYGE